MRIISWDIGIKNLTYCIVEDEKIIKWNKIDILNKYRKNNIDYVIKCNAYNKNGKECKFKVFYVNNDKYYCNKHKNNECKLYYTINNLPFYEKAKLLKESLINELDILNVDYVVIENQPVYKNPIMKSIQLILYSYYLFNKDDNNNYDIYLLNAKEKMKVYNGPKIECNIKNNHNRNKFLSIEYSKYILKNDEESLNYFNSFKKRDDIADTYLQAVYFIRNKI